MKKTAHYIILCTLSLCLFSCRSTGDDLLSYGQDDTQVYSAASGSFTNEFKAFWLALNENYGIWDYEEQMGVNWDKVYETYLPKFEELDDTIRHPNKVTDDELEELYSQFVDSLHDGHLYFQVKNLHTNKYIEFLPGRTRILRERMKDYLNEMNNLTNLDFYRALDNDDLYKVKDYDATDSKKIILEQIDTTCYRLIRGANAYIAEVDDDGGPNKYNDSIYAGMKEMRKHAQNFLAQTAKPIEGEEALKELVGSFNNFTYRYDLLAAQLDIATPQLSLNLAKDGLHHITYALFQKNIAYLRFGGFELSSYLVEDEPADSTTTLVAYYRAVNRIWHNWFDTIQSLHAAGQLGGVIIDVRNNGGGRVSDYQFVLGALLPSGGYTSHMLRVKNGSGRLDYGPLTPFFMPTYQDQHAVIANEPIVVLANSNSVSMSEITTWGVKSQDNGYFIGTRTYGGLSALNSAPSAYNETYSGCFGVEGETPIYGYVPRFVSLFGKDHQILEGIGITPDKEVPLDVNGWKNRKTDNQLEAALDYIQSH